MDINYASTRTNIKPLKFIYNTDYQPYKQLEFVCMAGVLWSQMAKFVCISEGKSTFVCI